jgi:hypothetical protein
VTNLQTSLEGFTAQNEFAIASPTNQPSFLNPTLSHSKILISVGTLSLKPHFRWKKEKSQPKNTKL